MIKKRILLLAGASAAGKTTVAKKIVSAGPRYCLVRSATTRPPRGDGNDAEYLYMSRGEFLSSLERGGFLEHTEFGSHLYGTPAFEIEDIFEKGSVPILILDLNGIEALRADARYEAFAVYLYADSATLERRLWDRISMGEGTEDEKRRQFDIRLERAKEYERLAKEKASLFDAFISTEGKAASGTAEQILSLFEE